MTTDILNGGGWAERSTPPLLTSRQVDEGSPVMSIPQYGDYQFDIYFDGLEGQLPKYPVDFASLERKAERRPDYRGFDRSPSVVFIQIFFNAGRSVDVKRAPYGRIT